MSPTGSIFLYESQLFRACGTPTAAGPDFHGNSKINRQTHQCNVFLIESAWSSLLINGHTVIIICCQFTTKFFLFLDWPVGSDFYQFANASGKIFFFLQRSVKSRRADLHDVAVLDEIIFVKPVAESPAYCLAVIHCDSTWFVNVAAKIPVSCFLDIFHIYQFESIAFYDRR